MDPRKALFKIYWRIEKIIAPTLQYSQHVYADILESYVNRGATWLDLGCGHQILPPWRFEQEGHLVRNCRKVVGIDVDLPSLKKHRSIRFRIAGDISNLPLPHESFDLVTANMVAEHLDRPETQFREILRILKRGGIFICHTPNRAGYSTVAARLIPNWLKKKIVYLVQGRNQEDVFRTFYRANSERRIRELAEAAGFKVVQIKMLVSSAQLVIFPPAVALELLWIRALMTKPLKPLRTNIIAILRKDCSGNHPNEYLSDSAEPQATGCRGDHEKRISGTQPARTSKLLQLKSRIRALLGWLRICSLYGTGLILWAKWRIRRKGGIVVLTFHRVLGSGHHEKTNSLPGMIVREQTFRSLAKYVSAKYETLSVADGEVVGASQSKKSRLAFTFDDGWNDNARFVFPIALQHQIPLTIFICPGRVGLDFPYWPERVVALCRTAEKQGTVGSKLFEALSASLLPGRPCPPGSNNRDAAESLIEWLKRLPDSQREAIVAQLAKTIGVEGHLDGSAGPDATMTWAEITALAQAGVKFGSHGQTHAILTRVPEAKAQLELGESKRAIEGKLGTECLLFAYPNGDWSSRVRNLVEETGYKLSFINRAGVWTRDTDPLLVPRINLSERAVIGPSGRFSPLAFEYAVFWQAYRARKIHRPV